jgi:hypothetical protein
MTDSVRGRFLHAFKSWDFFVRDYRRSLWRRHWSHAPRRTTTRKSAAAALAMRVCDLGQHLLHTLVGALQILNCLFDIDDKVFLAISCHFGMHAVAFSAARVIKKRGHHSQSGQEERPPPSIRTRRKVCENTSCI